MELIQSCFLEEGRGELPIPLSTSFVLQSQEVHEFCIGISVSLQGGFRFFHPPLPALLSARLTARFPVREKYGFTTFHNCDLTG